MAERAALQHSSQEAERGSREDQEGVGTRCPQWPTPSGLALPPKVSRTSQFHQLRMNRRGHEPLEGISYSNHNIWAVWQKYEIPVACPSCLGSLRSYVKLQMQRITREDVRRFGMWCDHRVEGVLDPCSTLPWMLQTAREGRSSATQECCLLGSEAKALHTPLASQLSPVSHPHHPALQEGMVVCSVIS